MCACLEKGELIVVMLIVSIILDGEGHMEESPSLSEVRRIGRACVPILFPPPSSRPLSPFSSPPHTHTG